MSLGFEIRENASLDLLSLGALVNRLDPGIIPFRKAHQLSIHVSGGEFNVAANLSDGFGMRTGIATAMVDYPLGDLIAERVRAMGVKPYYKRFVHDGVRGPNMATVYSDQGLGVRAPVVFYNRANEAGAMLKSGDFDWNAICAKGVRWAHSGGIFAALSATTAPLAAEMMKTAKESGAVTSFDLNFREKLSLFNVCADIRIPLFEITVCPSVNWRVDICLHIRRQNDLLCRAGTFRLYYRNGCKSHLLGFLMQGRPRLDAG